MKHFSRGTAGVSYSPLCRGAGQVSKETGRDRLTPSTAVRLQDRYTAPLRTLVTCRASQLPAGQFCNLQGSPITYKARPPSGVTRKIAPPKTYVVPALPSRAVFWTDVRMPIHHRRPFRYYRQSSPDSETGEVGALERWIKPALSSPGNRRNEIWKRGNGYNNEHVIARIDTECDSDCPPDQKGCRARKWTGMKV